MLKNIVGSGGWKFKCVLALGLLASSGAWADPLPGGPFPFEVDTWTVGGFADDDRITVSTGDGTWDKQLALPDGAVDIGDTFTLTEYLTIAAGDSAWTSWTETILTSGWIWSFGDMTQGGDPVGGLAISGVGTSTIKFTFDEIDPGTSIEFTKTLECVGSGTPTNLTDCTGNFITVRENAVPEPGTLLLLVGGLAGLAGLRRRRSS